MVANPSCAGVSTMCVPSKAPDPRSLRRPQNRPSFWGALVSCLPEQAVGVFVGAALPGTARIAEVDLQVGCGGEAPVASHLLALVPCQRAPQLLGQCADLLGERRQHSRRVPSRQLHKHREPAVPLDQGDDVGVVRTGEQITLPMTGDGAILGLGRSLADGDNRGFVLAPSGSVRPCRDAFAAWCAVAEPSLPARSVRRRPVVLLGMDGR